MVHGMSKKWSMSHFVAQKVTLMTQLNINIITANEERSSYTTEVKKLPFMQKCPSRFSAIKLWKENDISTYCLINYLSNVFAKFLKTNDVNSV